MKKRRFEAARAAAVVGLLAVAAVAGPARSEPRPAANAGAGAKAAAPEKPAPEKPAAGKPAAEKAAVHPFRDNVKVDVTDDLFIVHSNGIPDHTTGPFPSPRNPNAIREQNYTFKIPRHPKAADKVAPLPMGPIGVAVNGVPFYNPHNREMQDAAKMEVFDDCCGHPDPMGRYHYHIYPKCVHTSFKDEAGKHSPLIGYAFDGYAIYGPNGVGGVPPGDLDECNGHAEAELGYHYHVTGKFPYILGAYHGVVEAGNLDRHGPPAAAGRAGARRGRLAPETEARPARSDRPTRPLHPLRVRRRGWVDPRAAGGLGWKVRLPAASDGPSSRRRSNRGGEPVPPATRGIIGRTYPPGRA